jgi:hypothetical protein
MNTIRYSIVDIVAMEKCSIYIIYQIIFAANLHLWLGCSIYTPVKTHHFFRGQHHSNLPVIWSNVNQNLWSQAVLKCKRELTHH